jgi:hypothetical protein
MKNLIRFLLIGFLAFSNVQSMIAQGVSDIDIDDEDMERMERLQRGDFNTRDNIRGVIGSVLGVIGLFMLLGDKESKDKGAMLILFGFLGIGYPYFYYVWSNWLEKILFTLFVIGIIGFYVSEYIASKREDATRNNNK